MGINTESVYLAARVIKVAVEAAESLSREAIPAATKFVTGKSSSGVAHTVAAAEGTVQAPAVLGERMGTMVTNPKIKEFAEDLYRRSSSKWEKDYELEDNLHDASWDYNRIKKDTVRALEQAGIVADLDTAHSVRLVTEQVSGNPEAQSVYGAFLRSRQELLQLTSQYNKAVIGPRFSDIHQATTAFTARTGIFMPRLRLDPLSDSIAAYADGNIVVSEQTLTSMGRVVANALAHEATHEEQEILQIGLGADQLNIGAKASEAQLQTLHGWARGNGLGASVETVTRALDVRAGRFLTDEAAARASATRDSMRYILDLQRKEAPNRMRFAALDQTEARYMFGDDTKGILAELGHPKTGLAFNAELFGPERAAEQFRKYADIKRAVPDYSALSEEARAKISQGLYDDLRAGKKDLETLQKPFEKEYLASAHETEAFANGAFAESVVATLARRQLGY